VVLGFAGCLICLLAFLRIEFDRPLLGSGFPLCGFLVLLTALGWAGLRTPLGFGTFLWARFGGENYYDCERRENRESHVPRKAYAETAGSSRQNTASIPNSPDHEWHHEVMVEHLSQPSLPI
jgi:hypothetical protein